MLMVGEAVWDGGGWSMWELSVLSDQFCWGLKTARETLIWERSEVFSLLVASNKSFLLWKKKTAREKLTLNRKNERGGRMCKS